MLLEIREKVHGVLASIILVVLCVLFGLWGIQNYLGGGKETPVVSVGDKDFFQNDVNRAYQDYAQSVNRAKLDEETIRKQALYKLVREEVLLQYVQKQNLIISDETAKDYIKGLDYFKVDGKFDKGQYQSLLSSQGMSSDEFINRIKKALLMEQFQRSIVDSSFVTPAEIASFFKIQNQKRDIEYLSLPLNLAEEKPSEEEINSYYQQHQDAFQTEEMTAVNYVELDLDKLSEEVQATDEQLKAYYEEQKNQFTTKERRRISHILFAFSKDPSADNQALEKATKAKEQLKTKSFEALAAEVSDDKSSAKKGGDLGLFNAGVMEKSFEEVASRLKLGEVSEPVKSAFGYHLIKVTELSPQEIKPYSEIKTELLKSYQRSQAENKFNTLAEKLAEVSYENPDNLDAAAKLLNTDIRKTSAFTKTNGEGIAANEKVRLEAFSEDVLKGSNSEPIELSGDKLVVLRMLSHQASTTKELKDVKGEIVKTIEHDKAEQKILTKAEQLKTEFYGGKSLTELAQTNHLPIQSIKNFSRQDNKMPPNAVHSIFSAAKPQNGQSSVILIDDFLTGGKILLSVTHVTEGEMSKEEQSNLSTIENKFNTAIGNAQFEAVLNSLQAEADIVMHPQKP